MIRSSEDRQFARFRRTGDPDALAAVFDRTAPELLRVASHLAGDRAGAEDLVQETFVAAIGNADGFDVERRVLPWLLGILANLARRRRRAMRAARGSTTVPDTAMSEQLAASDDPLQSAADAEFRSALDVALRALPRTYREVLTLHLRHGLTAKEIGAALDRSESTVRTQVQRGMQQLRRVLPAGFAAAATVAALPTRGLAAVRSELLAGFTHAGSTGATGATGTTGTSATLAGIAFLGGTLMTKKIVLGAVSLAAVLLAAVWLGGSLSQGDGSTGARERVPGVLAAPPPAREAAAEPRTYRRDEIPTASAGSLVVQVSFADGRPAPDIGVWLEPEAGIERREPLPEGRTDAQGEVAFAGVPVGNQRAWTDRGAAARCAVSPGGTSRVAIVLPRGPKVAGRVVDGDGEGVAGAIVSGFGIGPGARGIPRIPMVQSGTDGRFAIEGLQGHGGFSLWARSPRRVSGPPVSVYGAEGERVEVTLLLGGKGQRLEGRVRRAGGAVPSDRTSVCVLVQLPFAEPRIAGKKGYEPSFHAYPLQLDAGGRFAADWVPAGRAVVIALDGDQRSLAMVGDRRSEALALRGLAEVDVLAGVVNHVEVELHARPRLRGRVRDERGEPLGGIEVVARRLGQIQMTDASQMTDAWQTTRADGSYDLSGLLPGSYEFKAERGEIEVRARRQLGADEVHEWNPVLARGRDHRVRVVGAGDEPLAGWRVEWSRRVQTVGGNPWVAPFHSERTDAEGRCRAENLDFAAYTIRVQGPMRQPSWGYEDFDPFASVTLADVWPGEAETLVRVPEERRPSARVRGRVVDAAGAAPAAYTIEVWRDAHLRGRPRSQRIVGAATGAFELGPYSPGRVSLRVFRKDTEPGLRLGPFELAAGATLELGELRLPAPCHIVVRPIGGLAAQGEEPGLRVLLSRNEDGDPGWGIASSVSWDRTERVYRSVPLPGSRYLVQVLGRGIAPVRREVGLREGEERVVEVDLRPVPAVMIDVCFATDLSGIASGTLEIVDGAGRVVVRERLFGYFDDLAKRRLRRTFGLAPGGYVVKASGSGGQLGRQSFTVPCGDPVVVELRQ